MVSLIGPLTAFASETTMAVVEDGPLPASRQVYMGNSGQSEMKKLPAAYLAWSLWAFVAGLSVATVLIETVLVPSVAKLTLAGLVAQVVVLTAMATVGAVVASRRPENLIGWLLLSIPIFGAMAEATIIYARYAVHVKPGALPGGAIAGLLATSMWVIAYGLIPFITLLFPRGTLLSTRWRWVAWGLGAAFGTLIVADFLLPEVDLEIPPPVTNPLAISSVEPILDAAYTTAGVAIAILWAAAGVSLVLRFARSSGDERQQIKWFAYTAAIFAVFTVVSIVSDLSGEVLPDPVEEFVFSALFLSLSLGLAMAILKYRLYDIDLVINRTLVYGSLTAMLAAIYVAAIFLLQLAFRAVTDQAGPVAFVISTLAIAALFQPLRRRIQDIIDRRLYRRKYDASRTLEALSVRMRDEVDLSRLNDDLLAAVRETVQPSHVSLRLLETADAEERGWMKVYFQTNPNLVEIDNLDSQSPAVQALRAAGTRITVPLVSQGELVGLINLGPRLSGQDYSAADRKLLSDMATQAAPAVRVGELVRQQQAEAEERGRTEQELRIARVVQQTLLPQGVPSLPEWELAVHYQPARAVGGDFYDFIELPEGELGIVIGDVTDKGTPAALVMATTRSLLRPAAQRLISPGRVLELVNDLLHPDIPPNMFVTCLYAVLDPSSGAIRYANAGHDLPYQRTTNSVVELRATGMPLGLMPRMSYEEIETTIAPGDSVLLYSDGLIEAHNPSREMFGFPRAKELVAAHPGGESLIQYLLAELADFTGEGWEQEDDVTLMTLQRDSTKDVGGEPT